ncbi:FimV/HubP family polar landmark protein [Thioalkalivibrio sp. ALJ16]|uniref:FimV/HubP family polar landmark protein n=1 Tax=Thioalkalivibrio sp. ALJ16 TaxID=1158762 RepID=UPI00036F05AF|nr:FimV/HubP family polar landmark protein [Thioalkalivibrio sp. ALJ16]
MPALVTASDTTTYTVRSQDTLWSIAERLRPSTDVSVQQMMLALYEHNPHAFDGALERLRAGATLTLPPADRLQQHVADAARARVQAAEPLPAEQGAHRVRSDETLWSIATRLRPDEDMPVRQMAQALYEHNPNAFDGSIDRLRAGSVLRVPPELARGAATIADAASRPPPATPDSPDAQALERAAPGASDPREPETTEADDAADADPSPARGFTFGAARPEPDEEPDAADAPATAWDVRLDDLLLEAGILAASDRPVDTTQYARGLLRAGRPLGDRWELRLGVRADLQAQQGGDFPERTRARADYDENYLRYRGENARLTVGTQRILWGRVDEIPPTDRLSTKDLTRFGLDPYAERRRANPAIRAEWFQGPWHADLVFLPLFRPAELPDRDSLWHPVDRTRGRLLGLPADPALAPVVQQARLEDDVSGDGGGGIRLGRSGRGADLAVTVQRARHSQPYYRFDEPSRQALAAGTTPDDPALEAVHPRTWVVGGDTAFTTGAWTWRAEAAWLSDVPVTRRADLRQTTVEGVDWVVGVEGFPGDGDFRMTTQLAGQHLLSAGDVLDARESYFATGEFEAPFSAHSWRARLRYSLGLNRRDIYLNPELAWIANEPMELYLGLHWLDGAEGTVGGFYQDNRMLVLGWRGQF